MAKDKTADKLALLRAKLEKTNLGGGNRTEYFDVQEGDNTIRILPEVGNMEWFFQEVGIHYMPNKKRAYCPRVFSDGEMACPICELVSDLYNAGDDASREFAGQIRVSRKFWMNVIDRNNEGTGPQIYQAPVSVFSTIASVINDPDYGDITDPYEGVDIVVNKQKTGSKPWEVEYQVVPRRLSTPLASKGGGKTPDEDKMDEWLDAAKDLSWTVLTNDPEEDAEVTKGYGMWVMPYDRIITEILQGDEALLAPTAEDVDIEEDEEEVEEEVSPVQEEITERRARRARRRRAVS